jgi:serine/threonine protein kinase
MSRDLSYYSRTELPRATDAETGLRASRLTSASTLSEHFSSFVSLAASIYENEIAQGNVHQANFLRNMRDHDLGLWNSFTRPLGRGATFAVRRFVSSEEDVEEEIRAIDGRIAIKSVLLGLSTPQSEVAEKRKLASALLELRILSHKRVRACENIVRLLGVGWENDPVILEKKWPALLVEYADRGTLVDLFESQSDVDASLKRSLCLDVGRGLQVLHGLKVVHGDVKMLNVLLYADPQATHGTESRPIIAKLADFGGALLDMDDLVHLPTQTFPWNAPESTQLLQRDQLLATDVYSFGLLVWQVLLDGRNPFNDHKAIVFGRALTDGEIQREKEHHEFYRKARDSVHHYLTETQTDGYHDITGLFDHTLRLEASQRSLVQAIRLLEANQVAWHTIAYARYTWVSS